MFGARDDLVYVWMQAGFAAGQEERIHARADDAQDLHNLFERKPRPGLMIAARAEVFAVHAVEVALRCDVIDGETWVQIAVVPR